MFVNIVKAKDMNTTDYIDPYETGMDQKRVSRIFIPDRMLLKKPVCYTLPPSFLSF